jgi:hypothetical protein
MPSTLSFLTIAPSGRYPTSRSSDIVLDRYPDWGMGSLPSPMLMTSLSSSVTQYGGLYEVWGGTGYAHINTWVSPPVNGSYTISDNFEFVGDFQQEDDVLLPRFTYPMTYLTLSTNVHPWLNVYVYRPNTGEKVGTIVDSTLEPEWDTTLGSLQTWSIAPPESIIMQTGDKIVAEVYAAHINAFWIGVQEERFRLGGSVASSSMKLVFPNLSFTYCTPISTSDKYRYNIRGFLTRRLAVGYDLGASRLTSIMSPRYYLIGADHAYWYFDDISPARGRYSMVIDPRSEVGYDDAYITDYNSKWIFNEPSLHRFFMIDDFENYDSVADLHETWNVEDTVYSMVSWRTYSTPQNIEDYDILSFMAKSTNPTVLSFIFEDSTGDQSHPVNVVLTNRTERYEATVSWANMDRASFSKIMISSSASAHTIIDDIVLLDYETSSQNINWIKLGIDSLKEHAGVKNSTLKIPFRKNELIQMGGDDVTDGQITFRSNDTTQISFMDEMMRTSTPLYLRFKNFGLPIVLRNYENDYLNMVRGRISSKVQFDWTEIYDYELF